MIGTTLAHYRILDRLGQGGMGEVYLAEDTRLGRKVALKFLSPATWNDPEAQERMRREAKSASSLDHPNIVTIFGIEEVDGRPFIHMAHVPGVPLGEYAASERRTIAQVLELALQIADALAHAHRAGVVHRDLKPSNVLVDESGRARILDFGIATQQGASRLTMTGFTVGTLAYTPPEVIEGKESTPASDLYSLGVVLYQLLSGRLPHEADHDAALLYSILHDAPKPLAAHRADVPADVQRIVSKCMEKAPERRYADAAALIGDLQAARRGRAADAERAVAIERPTIAVLPFANMSADPENEFFSDGLTEELLNVLAKNPELKVTGRTSSFAFKGKNEDLRDIGQKLGVATLLEGSVRKAGNRVRITAQLVKVTDGFHLWSETYDRVIDDIFAVQDDIARAVSAALDVALLGKRALVAKVDAGDYAQFLQAKHFGSQMSKVASDRAIELFEDLLARNPSHTRAWCGLGYARLVRGGYGFSDEGVTDWKVAADAARRALALDPEASEAYEVLGWVHMAHEFRWAEAGEALRKAHALAPSAGGPLAALANWEGYQGNLEEAKRLGKEAVELDPLSPPAHVFLGRFNVWSGHYDEARRMFARALELSPGLVSARMVVGMTSVLEGRPEEGLAEIDREVSSGYRNYGRAMALYSLGRSRESDEALAQLEAEGDEWAFQLALIHAWRGEADDAFRRLEQSFELRDSGVATAKVAPALRSLHADPRWPAFLAKLGLTP